MNVHEGLMKDTLIRLAAESGILGIDWAYTEPGLLQLRCVGKETVSITWDAEDRDSWRPAFDRARAVLQEWLHGSPQKTPYRPGRTRVRFRVGGIPAPIRIFIDQKLQERRWRKLDALSDQSKW